MWVGGGVSFVPLFLFSFVSSGMLGDVSCISDVT